MTHWLIAVIIGLAIGLAIGVRIARESNRKQPVTGGPLAKVFHYLACSGLSTMLPFIIAGIVVGLSFLALFGTAIGFLALTGVCLLVYAGFERIAGTPSAAR
jgi:ABC-type Fe3+ transport system permease subunit